MIVSSICFGDLRFVCTIGTHVKLYHNSEVILKVKGKLLPIVLKDRFVVHRGYLSVYDYTGKMLCNFNEYPLYSTLSVSKHKVYINCDIIDCKTLEFHECGNYHSRYSKVRIVNSDGHFDDNGTCNIPVCKNTKNTKEDIISWPVYKTEWKDGVTSEWKSPNYIFKKNDIVIMSFDMAELVYQYGSQIRVWSAPNNIFVVGTGISRKGIIFRFTPDMKEAHSVRFDKICPLICKYCNELHFRCKLKKVWYFVDKINTTPVPKNIVGYTIQCAGNGHLKVATRRTNQTYVCTRLFDYFIKIPVTPLIQVLRNDDDSLKCGMNTIIQFTPVYNKLPIHLWKCIVSFI